MLWMRDNIMIKNVMKNIFFKPWSIWKPIWNLQIKTKPLILPISLFLISSTYISVFYFLTNNFAEWRGYTLFDSSTIIDDKIPFIKDSIYIYSTWYFLFMLVAISIPLNKKGLMESIYIYQSLILIASFCFITFILMPIKIDTRTGLDIGTGLEASLYELLYLADPPYNSWPSIHVSFSIFFCWTIIRGLKINQGIIRLPPSLKSNNLFKNIVIPAFFWTLGVLISISTMTTKQHYFFDFITGIILGVSGIILAKKCISNIESEDDFETFYN